MAGVSQVTNPDRSRALRRHWSLLTERAVSLGPSIAHVDPPTAQVCSRISHAHQLDPLFQYRRRLQRDRVQARPSTHSSSFPGRSLDTAAPATDPNMFTPIPKIDITPNSDANTPPAAMPSADPTALLT